MTCWTMRDATTFHCCRSTTAALRALATSRARHCRSIHRIRAPDAGRDRNWSAASIFKTQIPNPESQRKFHIAGPSFGTEFWVWGLAFGIERCIFLPVDWMTRRLADALQRTLEPAAVRLELWDGSSPYAGPMPVGTMAVRDVRTLLGLIV